VKLIGRYLKHTRDKGLVYKAQSESLECFVDAGFAGEWNPITAAKDCSTARSRSGFVIKYARCPILWMSKMQTEIALSTTESEYIALSSALREVIPLLRLINELKNAGVTLPHNVPKVHCKLFEDNSGALEMAKSPKLRPRTKHINLKYHQFREDVENGDVSIHKVDTTEQMADIFTKALPLPIFPKFRQMIMGWDMSDVSGAKCASNQRECDEIGAPEDISGTSESLAASTKRTPSSCAGTSGPTSTQTVR
jgi:hypothetical protein